MAPKSNITVTDSSIVHYTVNETSDDIPKVTKKPPLLCIGIVVMGLVCVALVLLTCLLSTPNPLEISQGDASSDAQVGIMAADTEQEQTTRDQTINTISHTKYDNMPSHGDNTIPSPKGETNRPVLHPSIKNNDSAIVDLGCLRLKGTHGNSGLYSFKGIPYAKPPVGTLRWQHPQPIKYEHSNSCEIKTSMDAKRFKEKCAKIILSNSSYIVGSEDCLYLNIWTPFLDSSQKLPVVVYIGDASFSSNHIDLDLSPNHDALSNKVVFVSINFRLDGFGVLDVSSLLNNSLRNTSEHNGLMDQICALKWIRSNIAQFGGDPKLVTLFGHKSGDISVLDLLVSPMAKGLFHRVWIASGPSIISRTVEEKMNFDAALLNDTDCRDTECRQWMSTREIMQTVNILNQSELSNSNISSLWERIRYLYGDGGSADGVAQEWTRRLKTTEAIEIPILIGSVYEKVDPMFLPANLSSWDWTNYVVNVRKTFGYLGDSFTLGLLKQYRPVTDSSPELQYRAMLSDLLTSCPSEHKADLIANISKGAVYRYVITADIPISREGPDLAVENLGVIQNLELLPFFGDSSRLVNATSFRENFQEIVLNFIRTGTVATKAWFPFPNSTALINDNSTIVSEFHKDQCNFWKVLLSDMKL